MNNPNLSTTTDNVEVSFDDIAKAVQEGNKEALDRLMTGTPAQDQETQETEHEEDTPSEKEDAETPEQGENESSSDVEKLKKDEAATSAASPVSEPEEVVRLKQEIHRLKSDAGRVPFLQRRLQELDRELRALKARTSVTATPNTASAKPSSSANEPELSPEVQAKIAAMRQVDPDLADTIETVYKDLARQTSEKAAKVAETLVEHDAEQEQYEFFMQQREALLSQIPQADQIFATPEWKQWKDSQTPGMRALTESGYAEDMVKAIYAFAADMQRFYGSNQQASQSSARSEGGDPANNNTSTVAQPADQTVTKEIADARSRKVQASADTKPAAAKAQSQLDEEAFMREQYNKILKEMGLK